MSTATAAEEPVVPAVRGKKKLILIIVAVAALVLAAGGGGAAFLMNKSADAKVAAAEGEDAEDAEVADAEVEDAAPLQSAGRIDPKATPVFVPLDPFTVNLADRNADRYAQVGITLEIDNAKTGDRIKAFMPVIRNNILMAIADRTAEDLLAREGKAQLAERVRRETSRAMGYAVAVEDAAAKGPAKAGPGGPVLPVKAVHFSNFIVQ
ncbi:MAG: flagellar basal body-associated FliL family protein [Rubrivivax sp.]|nr:flagellar basal body-associated FliL family protein [Rubrivivax sp.]